MAALVKHFGDVADASRVCGVCDVCDPAGAVLRLFRRASNGKVQHPFRDSLIENVRAIVRLAPTLNLLDDPRIGELCADIEQHLTAHDPEQLRNSARLRESVADEADAILRRMQGAFA